MEGRIHASTTIAGVCLNQLWHKQLDTDDSEKLADGLFCTALALKKKINHLKIVINGILPCDE